MHSHGKQFTEPIFAQLARYRAELEQHPLLTAARKGELTENVVVKSNAVETLEVPDALWRLRCGLL